MKYKIIPAYINGLNMSPKDLDFTLIPTIIISQPNSELLNVRGSFSIGLEFGYWGVCLMFCKIQQMNSSSNIRVLLSKTSLKFLASRQFKNIYPGDKIYCELLEYKLDGRLEYRIIKIEYVFNTKKYYTMLYEDNILVLYNDECFYPISFLLKDGYLKDITRREKMLKLLENEEISNI